MDVSCPQCRTEYEFEDARIPDEGLTVKCTQCAHVFRMKKKGPPPAVPSPADEGREWRLRQPSGNVFNFKHLTTLQKWIVERKVQKQDEISLTGDGWKRLGDIAELASFFQVVDDAVRLTAAANQQKLTVEPPAAPLPVPPPPPPPPAPPPPAPAPVAEAPKLTDTIPSPAFSKPPPEAPRPPTQSSPLHEHETLRGQNFSISQNGGPPIKRGMGPVRSAYRQRDDDDIKLKGQGGMLKWVALALFILGGGGAGGYYYVTVFAPEQAKLAAEHDRLKQKEDQERAQAEQLAAQKKIDEAVARARAEQEAAAVAAAAAKADAGPPAAIDAGLAAGVDAGVKAKPMDFDQLLAAGERLRSRDKAEAALALFTRAAELKPDRVEPQSAGGFALLDMEKPDQAEMTFRGALQLNPRYGPALIGMAEASKQNGKKAQAIEYYKKYLDVLPEGPEAEVARNSIERLK